MLNRTIYVTGTDLAIFEDVYETLDELNNNIPEELYESIVRYNNGEDVEILDI